jgi:predicted Rossmann-fold nucleotide-binding protein
LKKAKAYREPAFINSRDARPLRILAEYLEPKSRFEHFGIEDTIVFFGSARFKEGNRWYEAARRLAFRLTEWSKALPSKERRFVVCTGGGPGIMEAANRGAAEARGMNVGLTISIPVEEFARGAKQLLPEIEPSDLVPAYSGIRAKLVPPSTMISGRSA